MINFLFVFALFNMGEFPISAGSGWQRKPSVAYGGGKYFVAWEDSRKTGDYFNNDIWGQLVSKDGVLIDSNFPICTADSGQWRIDIASGDSNYLVVWQDHSELPHSFNVCGQLVSYEGNLIGSTLVICDTDTHEVWPQVIWGNGHYLVVWTRNYGPVGGDSCKLMARFIKSDGSFENSIFFAGPRNSRAKLAFDGKNYLLTWCWSALNKGPFYVSGQLMDSMGVLIDTAFTILEGQNNYITVNVAINDSNYLVVGDINDTMMGQLVGLDGKLIGNRMILCADSSGGREDPSIGWNGTKYLAVWEDFRNGSSDIYGQWISGNGNLIDGNVRISFVSEYEYSPDVAFADSSCLVAWSDTRQYQNYDVYGSIVNFVGVEEQKTKINKRGIKISPNPFVRTAGVRGVGLGIGKIRIYDISGKLVEETDKTVIGKNLRAGIYFVKIGELKPLKITKIK